MKALKYRNIAFIVIGVISFILNFTIQNSFDYRGYKGLIDCFGNIFVLAALILWAIGITGLMQLSKEMDNKPRRSNTPETKGDVERWLNEDK